MEIASLKLLNFRNFSNLEINLIDNEKEPNAICYPNGNIYITSALYKKLESDEELTFVVTSAVNTVGVDLNTASGSLLKYVSGLTGAVANNIVKYRDEHGIFTSREDLLKVSRLNDKVYQQAAGFLRVKEGTNPLDATGIHPESYEIAKRILHDYKISYDELGTSIASLKLKNFDANKYIKELNTDIYTIEDVIKYYKPEYNEFKRFSPTLVLYNSGLFGKILDELDRLDAIESLPKDVGRNDPCPCGSGKKYKNCCLNK